MNSILEELYYGNLEPFVRCIRRNSKMDRACRTMAETEEHFLTVLRDDEKEKFAAYMDAANQIESASSLDGFLVGFRLGAKMIYDTFISEQAPRAGAAEWLRRPGALSDAYYERRSTVPPLRMTS